MLTSVLHLLPTASVCVCRYANVSSKRPCNNTRRLISPHKLQSSASVLYFFTFYFFIFPLIFFCCSAGYPPRSAPPKCASFFILLLESTARPLGRREKWVPSRPRRAPGSRHLLYVYYSIYIYISTHIHTYM
jgi:hypothetical protein